MDAMLEAARKMRHGHRDATMLLIAYRHGLRASEITTLPLPGSRGGTRRPVTAGPA